MADQQQESGAPQQQVISQAEVLEKLQAENEGLKARLEKATSAALEHEELDRRLAEAQMRNGKLRARLAAAAIREAVTGAADQVGISPASARTQEHKFRCDIDDDGRATVTPDPVEFFGDQMRADPSLRAAAEQRAVQQRAAAVADGAVDVEQTDPVELMAALDRSAAKKTRFIARHGVQAYLELCDRARREDRSR